MVRPCRPKFDAALVFDFVDLVLAVEDRRVGTFFATLGVGCFGVFELPFCSSAFGSFFISFSGASVPFVIVSACFAATFAVS